jgi:hypothetical protein
MQVKDPQTRATKVNSEHHKVSESSSANAQRMRATNLPCHRQQPRISKTKILRIAGFDKRNRHCSSPAEGLYVRRLYKADWLFKLFIVPPSRRDRPGQSAHKALYPNVTALAVRISGARCTCDVLSVCVGFRAWNMVPRRR